MASNALKALLGVLAFAGYRNRDKIVEILRGLRNPPQPGPAGKRSKRAWEIFSARPVRRRFGWAGRPFPGWRC
jgi:hypothetical protein